MTLKAGQFTVYLIEKRNRNFNTVSISSSTNSIIHLRVRSISELTHLWTVTVVQSLLSHTQIDIVAYVPKKTQKFLRICNIRPNTTQRRSVEKVPINDWQASFILILLVFHRLDLAS